MGCSICIWSHDIKVLFLSSDPVKDILDMLALDLRSKNKKEPATSEQQAWQPVPEMIGWSYERNIMETKQLKRIADAIEEILRLIKKDMKEIKKAAKWKK